MAGLEVPMSALRAEVSNVASRVPASCFGRWLRRPCQDGGGGRAWTSDPLWNLFFLWGLDSGPGAWDLRPRAARAQKLHLV